MIVVMKRGRRELDSAGYEMESDLVSVKMSVTLVIVTLSVTLMCVTMIDNRSQAQVSVSSGASMSDYGSDLEDVEVELSRDKTRFMVAEERLKG